LQRGAAIGHRIGVTYRNDHDAALDRIDALELDLARSEAERAGLHDEIGKLRDQPAASADQLAELDRRLKAAIAERDRLSDEVARLRSPAPGPALDVDELVQRFETALRGEARRGWLILAVFVCGMALSIPMAVSAGGSAFILMVAYCGMAGWGFTFIGKPSSVRARTAVAALRDAPEEIVGLGHTIARGERIRIATASGVLTFTSRDGELFADLRRRCPGAARL
jgi:chorismate mutase